jgi:polysaccharide biosynthesis protein PslH
MRILQICNRVPYPPHDGGAIAMLNMTKAFYTLGHELHLLCLNTKKHYTEPDQLPELFQNIASFKAIDLDTDVKPLNAALNLVLSRRSYNVSRFYSSKFCKGLVRTLEENNFDIIHIEGLHMCVYLSVIRQYTSAKIILRAHNLEYLIWERLADHERNPFKRYYLNILASRLWKFEIKSANAVDAIVPITDNDAELFIDNVTDKVMFVSPAGLDLDDYKIDRSRTEWPGIFHLGALNWIPNQEAMEWFLKEVWPKVHKEFPKVKFYIAGRDTPAWLEQLQKVGVQTLGEVENAVDFMNGKSIMVVPLLSGSGMRIKIIEGMALAKTIISTAIGAEGIHYEDQKNILIADTPEAFFFAIKKCVNNHELANRIGKNARQLAEKEYSNVILVQKLVDFYQSLIAAK